MSDPAVPRLTPDLKAAYEALRKAQGVVGPADSRGFSGLFELGLAEAAYQPIGFIAVRPVVTRVMNVHLRDHKQDRKDPGLVYVGRGNRFTGHKGSILQNKYVPGSGPGSVLNAVRSFALDLAKVLARDVESPAAFERDRLGCAYAVAVRAALAECRGKTVCCWCADWSGLGPPPQTPCHAVCVTRAADGLDPLPQEWRF